MQKGLISILVSISIFIIAITLLSGNYYIQKNDYSVQIIDAKTIINNYEIVLNQAVQDCNWIDTSLEDCVRDKEENLTEMIFNNMECQRNDFIIENNKINFYISCGKEIIINNEIFFEIDLNKEIILEKY